MHMRESLFKQGVVIDHPIVFQPGSPGSPVSQAKALKKEADDKRRLMAMHQENVENNKYLHQVSDAKNLKRNARLVHLLNCR